MIQLDTFVLLVVQAYKFCVFLNKECNTSLLPLTATVLNLLL